VKNLAMGCVSGTVREKDLRGKVGRGGMHTMHKGQVVWSEEGCTFCGLCAEACPLDALVCDEEKKTVAIDYQKCWSCCRCARICRTGAMKGPDIGEKFQDALAECAAGVLKTFEKERLLFLNFLLDIQPECDCMPAADVPVVQDMGILMSPDPCSVDLATCDLIEAADPLPGSAYTAEHKKEGKTAWEALHGRKGRRHAEILAKLAGYETEYAVEKIA
jgi:hypothetical protein